MGQRESRDVDQSNDDGISWWMKLLARGIGVIAGLAAMILGVAACLTVTPKCLAAGVLQVVTGFMVLMFESPCCCQALDITACLTKFIENRTYWQKTVFYFLLAVPPVLLCIEFSTLGGSGLIFVSGAFYGILALGKKADRGTMQTRAAKNEEHEMSVTLVNNEQTGDP